MSQTSVTSASLIQLQQELKALSRTMTDLYETLNGDMGQLAQSWGDSKFTEFQEDFRSRQEMLCTLAEKYDGWASSYLPPRIELALRHEQGATGI